MKRSRSPYYLISLLLVVLLMGSIFFFSAQSAPVSDTGSLTLTRILRQLTGKPVSNGVVRHFAHVLEFAALGFWVLHLWNARFRALRPFVAIALTGLYAWSDEIHQLFVPGRAFQYADVAVDLFGAVFGAALATLLVLAARAVRRKRENKVV